MMRVLVLGGYGGFGARLSRRLAADGWQVLVGGRDQAAAMALARQLPGARAVVVDRLGNLADVLRAQKPFLLIDAAGPFQGADGRVIGACIVERVHYLDLADARDFVDAIGAFDEAAHVAGITVITGASSVPALSGAVIAQLASGMTAVTSVQMSISASNQATAGPSVARAILSYVGGPLQLWCGKRWTRAYGWQRVRQVTYSVPGAPPLHRLVALADVPDHSIWPQTLPGRPKTVFWAGPELRFQLLFLWCLSWPVRWGWIASLSAFSPLLLPLQNLTRTLGSDASAVNLTITGAVGEALETRGWTLVATQGDGPQIPVMAAQILARDLHDGRLATGARHAGGLVAMSGFQEQFSKLAMVEHTTSAPYVPLYARVMGARFASLPAAVRLMHTLIADAGANGHATVTAGSSILARLVARIIGFPPAGEHALHVSFAENNGRETWIRDFSGQQFRSELSQAGDRLVERFGPMRFYFDLSSTPDGLEMLMRHWSILHIPMPLWLAPKSVARETTDGEAFVFDVSIALPLIGPVIRYRGRLHRL